MNDLKLLDGYQNIILDFDGTLASLVMDWGGWMDGMTDIYIKYEPEPKFLGQNFFLIQNDYVRKYGKILRDEIAEFVSKYEKEYIKGFEPNEQLVKYIKNHPNKVYHVLSSQSKCALDRGLEELQIDRQISTIVSRDDVIYIKPDTEGINLIIGDKDTSDYILLGDSDVDIQTAKTVGILSLRVQM